MIRKLENKRVGKEIVVDVYKRKIRVMNFMIGKVKMLLNKRVVFNED